MPITPTINHSSPPQHGSSAGIGSPPLGRDGESLRTTGRLSEDRPRGSGSGNAPTGQTLSQPPPAHPTNRNLNNAPHTGERPINQNIPPTSVSQPTQIPRQNPTNAPQYHHNGPQTPPPQTNNQTPTERARNGRKTRANIKVATLNVRGRTSPTLGQTQTSKWVAINRAMRDQKIGILCIQETHLCPEHMTQIDNLYARRLRVMNSSDPDRPGCSAGIAFVLNREITNTENATMQVIIPGRAAVLSINWHQDKRINILNIYAPNNLSDHKAFWDKIRTEWQRLNLATPDLMLGDFNLTEDPIDRAPARPDHEGAIDALRDLRNTLNVQDRWRLDHPHRRLFTFSSAQQTLSRLDRIYASTRHAESLIDWDAQISQIPTDHHMVSVRFAPPGVPHIGKGRWSWPLSLMTDENLLKRVSEMGITAQNEMEDIVIRSEETNPQKTWTTFKQNISDVAKDVAKTHLCKINQRIKALMKDLKKTAN
ncbi:Endonuclease/exonuclease/phosphatase, partial [Suillus tomentosus]